MGTWRIRYIWFWLLCVIAVPSTVAGRQQHLDATSIPAELWAHVVPLTGKTPHDCGLRIMASVEDLRASGSCGYIAAKGRTPFLTLNLVHGIDSEVFSGLLGTTEGIIYRFSYDSAPCDGPGCQARFTITRCGTPVVTRRGSGADFGCE